MKFLICVNANLQFLDTFNVIFGHNPGIASRQKCNLYNQILVDIQNLKSFLTLFLPYLDRTQDRAALRFLYRHVEFSFILRGSNNLIKEGTESPIPIVVVIEGLINYYTIEEGCQQGDPWIGVSGSILMPPPQDFRHSKVSELVVEALKDSKIVLIDTVALQEGIQLYPQLSLILLRFILPKAIYDVNQRNILFRIPELSSRIRFFQRLFPGVMELLPSELADSYIHVNSFDEY